MKKTIIKNIQSLWGLNENNLTIRKGKSLAEDSVLHDAYLVIEQGKIAQFGSMEDFPKVEDWNAIEVIDAEGRLVMPTFCDSHTHIVFQGSREGEFVDRIEGLSYEQIAANGGGILNSASRLQTASEDELYRQAEARLTSMVKMGSGAVEIKSGYGLTFDSELKMLRVIRRLKSAFPKVAIKSTFLGAHAMPKEYKQNRSAYINLIVSEMIPAIQSEGLADYIDVFCDRGFFTVEETDEILEAGVKAGLKPKIHANELDYSGGVQVGVKHQAKSVDHLECVGEDEITVLKNSETMPTLLPSTAFFLQLDYPPARTIIDADLPVALATDYNPGSSPSGNMCFVMSLACLYLKMTPAEALHASTLNGAYAMDLQEQLGSIEVGKKANLIITKPIPSLAFIPYSFGETHVETVMLEGETFDVR